MKRINFELISAEEELAGARQCITCLCCSLLTASGMAMLYKFDAMPKWGAVVGCALLLLFLVAGTLFAWLPLYRERKWERERLEADHASHVDCR